MNTSISTDHPIPQPSDFNRCKQIIETLKNAPIGGSITIPRNFPAHGLYAYAKNARIKILRRIENENLYRIWRLE